MILPMEDLETTRKITSTAINSYKHSYSKVVIMAFVIVFALLLGTAGACVAFALQITTLKSEMTSLEDIFYLIHLRSRT